MILYIDVSQVIIFKKYCNSFSETIDFVLANSEEPDEMPQYATFHLGLHCLPKVPVLGFLVFKGLTCSL